MDATHDHRHAPPAIVAGQLVSPRGSDGQRGEADQVGRLILGDVLHHLVHDAHVPVRWRLRCHVGQR